MLCGTCEEVWCCVVHARKCGVVLCSVVRVKNCSVVESCAV